MRLIADFHIHSKFSRATSRDMEISHIAFWAKNKGLGLVGTGDFTHPGWISELENKLDQEDSGFLVPKEGYSEIKFVLTSEVSSIYTKYGKVRKIHNLIFAPDFKTVKDINKSLGKIGNLWSDGRPILGLDSERLAEILFNINPDIMIIPAHIWTPWFSLFGSNSGFDKLEECFGKHSDKIFAVETGLSSDPEMNWRLSALDKITLVSNSDSHSGPKLGREANVFKINPDKFSYIELKEIIQNKDPKKLLYTIEFFPEEGKYHYDGHRNCGISWHPEESVKNNNICSKCGRPVTIGVLNRVHQLADRPEGYRSSSFPQSKHLIPLSEIIADIFNTAPTTVKVYEEYKKLISAFDNEFKILLDAEPEDIAEVSGTGIADGIKKMREGKVDKKAGYDGEYGVIKIKRDGGDSVGALVKTEPEQGSLF